VAWRMLQVEMRPKMCEPRKGVMTMKTTRSSGFTLMEIMIVVTIIGFLAGLALPAFMKSRATSQAGRCVTSMVKIEAAKEQWAMETFADVGSVCVHADLNPYFKNNVFPNCPASGDYTLNPIGSNVTCSVGGGHVLKR
jgi:prepilin-type N-terminal cleavage/methylation domain-containing protein